MIKYLSLFSGIGAFEKALDRLNIPYDLVGFSELDKYATKSYCAIHGVNESENLGDVTKIDEKALPKDLDLITYGFPCFTGDSLVTTSDGLKEIKDIKIGDFVLSHDGKMHEVTNWMNQGQKEIWQVKAQGFDEIRTTQNHQFYARPRTGQPAWVECKDLTKK